MTSSYSVSESFTLTHARYLASKVISDMYQCRRFYGDPSAAALDEYRDELVVMLAGGLVKDYEFGYKWNEQRVVSWQYRAGVNGDLVGGADDRSGGVYARADVTEATYFNFMSYSDSWHALTDAKRATVTARHTIRRTPQALPGDGAGTWTTDRTYSNAGVAITRRSFRPS